MNQSTYTWFYKTPDLSQITVDQVDTKTGCSKRNATQIKCNLFVMYAHIEIIIIIINIIEISNYMLRNMLLLGNMIY